MSITTSQQDREAAEAKLAEASAEQLQADLAYWSVAKYDHHLQFLELTEKRVSAGELFKEAAAWIDLISAELHSRRVGREAPIED